MRIGKEQLRILIMTASPACILLTPDRSSAGLVARGLFKEDEHGGCSITPDGLRALADEMQAGRVSAALNAMRRDANARRKRVAELQAKRAAKKNALVQQQLLAHGKRRSEHVGSSV